VIEAAYKALMKKYHPDRLGEAPAADRQKAAELNEAFQILRDPDRRTRYDNEQRSRQESIRRAAMAAAQPPVYQAPHLPRRGSRAPKILIVGGIAVAAILWWRDPDAVRDFFDSALAAQTNDVPSPNGPVLVKDVDLALEEYSKIRDKTGLLGLRSFSEDCFAAQSRAPTARALDYCVAFDHAAVSYGARLAGDDLPQIARFRPDEVEIRHETAARLVSDNDGWIRFRRAKLREITFQRLALAEPGFVVPDPPLSMQLPAASSVAAPPVQRSAVRPPVRAQQQQRRIEAPSRNARNQGDFLEREGYIY
jgi:curved DNA-binding protein CbpA